MAESATAMGRPDPGTGTPSRVDTGIATGAVGGEGSTAVPVWMTTSGAAALVAITRSVRGRLGPGAPRAKGDPTVGWAGAVVRGRPE
ncbi:MAG: hypothetical protein ACYCZV_15070, partial [Acidimicrobiales bacterium]